MRLAGKKMKRRTKSLGAVLGLALGAVAFILSGFEISVRIFSSTSDGKYGLSTYRVDLAHDHPILDREKYRISSVLGFEPVANQGKRNALGLVGRGYPLEKGEGTFRILLLGSALAEEDGLRGSIEERLNRSAGPGRSVEIWNAGCRGWGVHQYGLFLKHRGLGFAPDLVLVFLGIDDLTDESITYYRTSDGVLGYGFPDYLFKRHFIPIPFLMRRSHLYRFVVYRLNTNYGESREGVGTDVYLEMMNELCKSKGLACLVVLLGRPGPSHGYDDDDIERYEGLVKSFTALELDFIDLPHLLLEDALPPSLRPSPYDPSHPQGEGKEPVAEAITARILEVMENEARKGD